MLLGSDAALLKGVVCSVSPMKITGTPGYLAMGKYATFSDRRPISFMTMMCGFQS
jgi:hypothetical protein